MRSQRSISIPSQSISERRCRQAPNVRNPIQIPQPASAHRDNFRLQAIFDTSPYPLNDSPHFEFYVLHRSRTLYLSIPSPLKFRLRWCRNHRFVTPDTDTHIRLVCITRRWACNASNLSFRTASSILTPRGRPLSISPLAKRTRFARRDHLEWLRGSQNETSGLF